MNSRISGTIKSLVERKCRELNIKFNKGVYRRAKDLYKSLPDEKRDEFFKYFNIK